MPAENTVAIERHALGTLNYIRASMEAAGSVAVPGSAGFTMGAVGATAAVLASLPALARDWIFIWVVAAPVAVAAGAVVIARQAARGVLTPYSGPARRFVACLAPSLLAGAVLTAVLAWHDAAQLLPGTWLLLYGCAMLSAGVMTAPDVLRVMLSLGASFAALGVLAFVAAPRWHQLLLGTGFGALHLIGGVLIARRGARARALQP